jgi:WD40 repeat protein
MKASGEQNAINDVAWCPDNATIFAAVTADAKLQIWDLNASSIDPVVTMDTVLDDVLCGKLDDQHQRTHKEDTTCVTDSAAATDTPGLHNRPRLPGGRGTVPQADLHAPVAQLLKNLSQTVPKRSLTCLQFGEMYVTLKMNMLSCHGVLYLYALLCSTLLYFPLISLSHLTLDHITSHYYIAPSKYPHLHCPLSYDF